MPYRSPKRAVATAGLLFLLLGGPAGAEQSPWPTIFRGTAEVNVVNVEVVVTDARGRPVTGLGRDAFELFEDGRPVAISNFYAVADGHLVPPVAADLARPGATSESPPPAEQRSLHLILYVDNPNLGATSRNRVLNHLREFLRRSWRPEMRVMLVTNDRSLLVRRGFTADADEIFAALTELAETAPVNPRFDLERQQLIAAIEDVNVEAGSGLYATKDATQGPQGFATVEGEGEDQEALTRRVVTAARPILTQIRAYSQQRLQHLRETLRILDQLVALAAGLPGPKAVVYVSDGLPLRPGEELFEAYARRFEILPDVGPELSAGLAASRNDASGEFSELVAHANANRVTFYTLDAALSGVSARGSAAASGTAGGNFASWDDGMDSMARRNRQDSLTMMAQDTGGRYGLTASTLEATLQGIVTDFDNHYSLGYVAEPRDDQTLRTIAVKVRGEGLRVRHRRSSRDKTAVERAVERTQAALWLDGLDNPLGVTLETRGEERQEDGNFALTLLVKVPLAKLILLPGESEHQGRVTTFVAVRDEKGRSSGVNQHLCPIRIPNSEVLTALGRTAACGVHLLMRRGSQRIGVSVLDEAGAITATTHLALDVGSPQSSLDPPSIPPYDKGGRPRPSQPPEAH